MEIFKLEKAKGILKKCTTMKTKSKEENKLVLSNDISFLIEVDKRSDDGVDFLFPGYRDVENQVAARDGTHRGLTMDSKNAPDEVNITVFDTGGVEEVFSFSQVKLTGNPKLLMNSIGDSRLSLRIDARLTKKDMSRLVDYVDADIYITAEVSQLELPGLAQEPSHVDMGEAADAKADSKKNAPEPMQTTIEGEMDGAQVRALRENAGIKRPELIELLLSQTGLDVSVKTLQRYESGERPLTPGFQDAVKVLFEKELQAQA